MWIEMKAIGRTLCSLSSDQKNWLVEMEVAGYKAVWCAGADQAIEEIDKYMGL